MSAKARAGGATWAARGALALALCAVLGSSQGAARRECTRPRPVDREPGRKGGSSVVTGYDPKWRAPLDAVGIGLPEFAAAELASADAAVAASRDARKEIAFIDPGVPHFGKIVEAIASRAEIVVLDSCRDVVGQMAERLRRENDIRAVHVFTHGDDGRLVLDGRTAMDEASLAARGRELEAIRGSLAKGADVLVYGCGVAGGEKGRRFADLLARATGADVAASTDLTGAAASGGDWDLEYRTGPVETAAAEPEFRDAVLADLEVTTVADSGADATIDGGLAVDAADGGGLSLREAVWHANNTLAGPDTIRFASALAGQGIYFEYSDPDDSFGYSALVVTSEITIDGSDAPGLELSGYYYGQRHLLVDPSGSLSLRNLTLSYGYAKGGDGGYGSDDGGGGGGAAGLGGSILNRGTLVLEGCTLLYNCAQGGDGGSTSASGQGGGGGGGLAGGGYIGVGYVGGQGGPPNGGLGGTYGADGSDGGVGGGGGGGGLDGTGAAGSGGTGGFGGGGGGGAGSVITVYGSDGGPGGFGGGGGGRGLGAFYGFVGSGGFGGGNGTVSGGGGAGIGGAIFNYGGIVSAVNCTFAYNAAYGGWGPSNNGQGLGGGLFNRNGTCAILNCTFNGNAADGGGAVYNLGDGAAATMLIDNSILANSVGAALDLVDNAINGGTSTADGVNNVIEGASGFDGFSSAVDPLLVALADNGGPTQTMALGGSSPCLDAGDDAAAAGLVTDQRGAGFQRFDGTVDIGAYEEQQTANTAPSAVDDDGAGFATRWDAPFTTANVLTNDSDPDPTDTFSIQSIDTAVALGIVVDNGDGTFYYDPNGQFDYLLTGESDFDAFTYTVVDNHGATATATVTITINGPAPPSEDGCAPGRGSPWSFLALFGLFAGLARMMRRAAARRDEGRGAASAAPKQA